MKSLNLSIRTKIIAQFFLVILVFVLITLFWLLPTMKTAILKEKRSQIQFMVQNAVSLANLWHSREQTGELSREEAQKLAKADIKAMRYGPENKDYFWINDFGPTMVMHPYRADLNGKDLSGFKDPQGKALFLAMVKVCREKGEGLVNYLWQWKDDKTKIVPKVSYVKAFAPWGWIIGTGIYENNVED